MLSLLRRLVTVAMLTAVTACTSGVKLEPGAPQGGGAQTTEARRVAPVTAVGDELSNPDSPLAKRSVYFDFDSYDVQEQYRGLLEAHAKYLVSHNSQRVRIEGNTDERGPSEYNLALGQRRAAAVRRVLSLLGVADPQMEAVSFGKEKPKARGHDEAAWAENRRVDLDYLP